MVAFNTENIVKAAENGFVKKTFGGITPESAKEALTKVADGVKKMADDAVGAVQRELEAYKGKTAREMAEMTSRNDAVILSKDAKLAETSEQLETTKVALKKARATKTGKAKTLRNGNVQTVKVNQNGAKMTTETTATGDKVSVTVETLDGDVRKTKYSVATGKPKSTYTNTNGEQLIKYDNDGKSITQKAVNVKKGTEKPQLISDELVSQDAHSVEQGRRRTYSDGSYENIVYNTRTFIEDNGAKFNSKGQKISEFITDYSSGRITRRTFDPNTGKLTAREVSKDGKIVEKEFFTESGKVYKKQRTFDSGLKQNIENQRDKYGNISDSPEKLQVTYNYPKESQIKNSIVTTDACGRSIHETMKLRDGSTVDLDVNGWAKCTKATIKSKNGDIKTIEGNDKISSYLEQIGHEGTISRDDYFFSPFHL